MRVLFHRHAPIEMLVPHHGSASECSDGDSYCSPDVEGEAAGWAGSPFASFISNHHNLSLWHIILLFRISVLRLRWRGGG